MIRFAADPLHRAADRRPVLAILAAGLALANVIIIAGVLPFSGPLGWLP